MHGKVLETGTALPFLSQGLVVRSWRRLAWAGLLASFGLSRLMAVSLPYANDFSSYPEAPMGDFTDATGFSYDVEEFGEVYHYYRGGSATGVSLIDVPAMGEAPTDFSISTTFAPRIASSFGASYGFVLMSGDATGSTANGGYVFADWSSTNEMRLYKVTSSGNVELGTRVSDDVRFSTTSGSEFTLAVTGQYNESRTSLDLVFLVSDGIHTDILEVSNFDDATYFDNRYYGYRTYSGYETEVDFDNFQMVSDVEDSHIVSIPEPSMLALLLGVGVGVWGFSHRRQHHQSL